MDNDNSIRFPSLAIKTAVVHTITYAIMGMLASSFLDYAHRFARPEMACWMRPLTDPMVMAGPILQPLRGLVFALVLYPLREQFFSRKNGWMLMWWTLVAIGIFSTFGPAPGSIEGMIYTTIPLSSQLIGWLEVIPQAFLLSIILHYWIQHPQKRWLDWTLWTLFVILILLLAMGFLFTSSVSH
jgi:hypothetical protein